MTTTTAVIGKNLCDSCAHKRTCEDRIISKGWDSGVRTLCSEYAKQTHVTTHYDSIKAMTVGQMAAWLSGMMGVRPFDGSGDEYRRWLTWLEEECSND